MRWLITQRQWFKYHYWESAGRHGQGQGLWITASPKSKFKSYLWSILTREKVNEAKLEMFWVGEADSYRYLYCPDLHDFPKQADSLLHLQQGPCLERESVFSTIWYVFVDSLPSVWPSRKCWTIWGSKTEPTVRNLPDWVTSPSTSK